ncbi:hypothetical protein ABH924_001762 [Arthrobacter sp. GAS37]|uniref:hypothetical protein n=1 Tax=Arthrobacter sp. GAS37 TaxID=3156261 RepID=UPI003837CB52
MITTTSALYYVRLREDLPRDVAQAYWAGPHADIVRKLPHIAEYRQHHFSATDHGYWPATPKVGTVAPVSWRLDGFAEVRFISIASGALVPLYMREVFFDEQNVFEQVLGHLAGPTGGRWSTTGQDSEIGHRTTVLLRRRAGVSRRAFRRFVREQLAPALDAAGARELRSYTFLPNMPHPTPGIAHGNPKNRRYHGAVLFGTGSRSEVNELLDHPVVTAAIADQNKACSAVHAYSVERTVPVIGPTS